jgi:hypothetical protein
MRELQPRDRVVELLRTLREAREDWHWGSGGGGVHLMPSTYTEGSYAELERLLAVMRSSQRLLWWHTAYRYIYGATPTIVVNSRKTIKGREPVMPPRCELLISGEWVGGNLMVAKVYTWSERVDPRFVNEGVDWLLDNLHEGDTQQIQLPQVFLYRAMGVDRVAV